VWGINELYDLQNDPYEVYNLIRDPAHRDLSLKLRDEMWMWLDSTGGSQIPLKRILNPKNDHLYRGTY
jgi:hypothetical protein